MNSAEQINTNTTAPTEEEKALPIGGLPARVIEATQKLVDIFHVENALLKERKIAETKDLQNEKAMLTAHYQNELRALQMNTDCLGPKNSPIRQKLKKVTEDFQEEVKNHGRILLRLKTVSEGLVQSISSEASKKAGTVPIYDIKAGMNQNPANQPVNIALNQVI